MSTSIFVSARARAWLVAALLGLPLLAWGHGDEPHDGKPAAVASGTGLPRVETHTETFELVGQLREGELSLLIDRYDSNAPVLGAQVTVESGGIEAAASFHADHGDYPVSDERLLALLRQPGEHALVFTVTLGDDSDLLDGMLRHPVAAAPAEHAAGLPGGTVLGVLALLAALAAGAFVYLRRRARARALHRLGEPA